MRKAAETAIRVVMVPAMVKGALASRLTPGDGD
jgi:hypothetical protein